MHHNTDWFNWESKKSLEATINKDSSILFVGHDHLPQISFSTINGELDCIIAKGGTFNDPAISNNFVAITFDTDKQEFTTYSMVFGDKVFNVTKRDSKIIDIPFRYKDFILSKSFLLKLNEISWDGINPNTIFEFPTLKKSQTDEFKENKQIGNYEDFIQNIKDKDFCLLEGNELSGKSFLLKFLYKKSFVNGVPIFINANDIYKGDNIEKLIKRNFEEQYGEDKDLYSKYNQLDKQEKIVFIDNIDKVKDQQSETVYFTSRESEYTETTNGVPLYYLSGNLTNGCGAAAGAIVVGFYDKYYENLIPDYTAYFPATGKYKINDNTKVPALMSELYNLMRINVDDVGVNETDCLNGLRSYVQSKNLTVNYSSIKSSSQFSLSAFSSAINSNKPVLLFSEANTVCIFTNTSDREIITKSIISENHIYVGYGIHTVRYYNGNVNFRTDTYIRVATGWDITNNGFILVSSTASTVKNSWFVNGYAVTIS